MAIEVRRATVADVPSLEIIRRQAIEATYADQYPRDAYADLVATPDPDLPDWIESERHDVLVAESPVTPVAFAAVDRREGELLAVYTSPDYEGRGYASRLIETIADSVSTAGIDVLGVWGPDPVRGFFRRNGFEPVNGRRETPLPAQRMHRTLGGDR